MKLRNSKILRNIHDSSAYDLAAELGIVARIALIDDDILVDFSISKFQNPKPTIVIALNREADEVARWNFTEVESALSTGNGHLKRKRAALWRPPERIPSRKAFNRY